MLRIIKRGPWIALGALGAWLLDPNNGEERRRRVRERFDELVHPEDLDEPVATDVVEHRAA